MNTIIFLAWIVGIPAVLLLVARVVGAATHDELDREHFRLKGQRITFPVFWPALISLACFVWIVETWQTV